MNKEKFEKENVFGLGKENVDFAKYFTGECYLNMLTTERLTQKNVPSF